MKNSGQTIHIISFDIPYPPDYGGVIDVFYKLKALKEAGTDIILHCFRYGRQESEVLDKICTEVNYYPRSTGILSQLSVKPYIVKSRRSATLEKRLLRDRFPVLAEGLHSTAFLSNSMLTDRTILVRTTNVEHEYYRYLARGEHNPARKLFLFLESQRLKRYEKVLKDVSKIIAISPPDQLWFEKKFGKDKVSGVYAFHRYCNVESVPGNGDFILYHGKLDIAENYNAVLSLLPLFRSFDTMPLVVAGMNPPQFLVRAINNYPNVKLVSNPSPEGMQDLIKDAHVHLLVTTQPTGLKLKLLAALFKGRFVIANNTMVQGTGLEPLCLIGNSHNEICQLLEDTSKKQFTDEDIKIRNELLGKNFSNAKNARKLIEIIHSLENNFP